MFIPEQNGVYLNWRMTVLLWFLCISIPLICYSIMCRLFFIESSFKFGSVTVEIIYLYDNLTGSVIEVLYNNSMHYPCLLSPFWISGHLQLPVTIEAILHPFVVCLSCA